MNISFKKMIYIILSFFLLIFIPMLPIELPYHQKLVLALALSSFFLWFTEAIPLYVTSLYILFIEVVFVTPVLEKVELVSGPEIFMAPFSSSIIFLFLGGLLLARAISKYQLDKILANNVILFSKGSPKKGLLLIMFTTAFLSMWMSNTATTAMMLIVASALVSDLDQDNPFKKAFILGIPFAANLGGMGTPIGTPSNAIAIKEINLALTDGVTFFDWMLATIPFVIILIIILWFILIYFYRSPNITLKINKSRNNSFSRDHYIVISVFVITAALWLTTNLHHISTGMVALLPAIFFLATGILNRKDFLSISYDVLYLVAGGIALSEALKVSGVTQTLVALLPLEDLSPMFLTFIFVFLGSLMTTFISNTATANIVVPMIFIIPSISHLPIAISTTMAISSSMILPVSTPPNAIAYSSGDIALKDMIIVGFVISLLSIFLILIFGGHLWKLLNLF